MAAAAKQEPVAASQIRIFDLMPPKWRKTLPEKLGYGATALELIIKREDTTHPVWGDILDFIEAHEKKMKENAERTVKLKNKQLAIVYQGKK